MKIARYESKEGVGRYAAFDPGLPGRVLAVEGDIFGNFIVTDREVKIDTWLPPVEPVNVFALGFSYGKHAQEAGTEAPTDPVVFMKATTSVIAHHAPILLPAVGPDRVDYEGELAVVIGKKAKNVPAAEAMEYIFGYTCANDVSARDWQFERQKGQWIRGKSFDTFCPLGPVLVTKDEIRNPNDLSIQTILNGHLVQDASTGDMIFTIPQIVAALSRSMTLLPGTVILTGTPEGVGFTRQPPLYLREGDVVIVHIEGVGTLSNPVRREGY